MKPYHQAKAEFVGKWERAYLAAIMDETNGDLSKAAKMAGVSEQTLYRLMQFYGGVRTFRKAVG